MGTGEIKEGIPGKPQYREGGGGRGYDNWWGGGSDRRGGGVKAEWREDGPRILNSTGRHGTFEA